MSSPSLVVSGFVKPAALEHGDNQILFERQRSLGEGPKSVSSPALGKKALSLGEKQHNLGSPTAPYVRLNVRASHSLHAPKPCTLSSEHAVSLLALAGIRFQAVFFSGDTRKHERVTANTRPSWPVFSLVGSLPSTRHPPQVMAGGCRLCLLYNS